MQIGDSRVMVSGTEPRGPTRAFLYLYVEDADATYERAIKAGREIPGKTDRHALRRPAGDGQGSGWERLADRDEE
jgi:PhnB protein